MGFFPVDEKTIRVHGADRPRPALTETIEEYYKVQGLWRDDSRSITYSSELELDLATVTPALAGPKRPQDRIDLGDMKRQWEHDLESGLRPPGSEASPGVAVSLDDESFELEDGDVVIAAITSCTNTSNPDVMVGAGLVARKARELGLTRQPWVKTSLAPGSKVVTDYLEKSGLLTDLEAVGFYVVGYGCTTCIGNSGPLPEPVSDAIQADQLVVSSVLSGNRNFEGRINPDVRANYLASPPLVVAYALAGTVDIDLTTEPIGQDRDGRDVFLRGHLAHAGRGRPGRCLVGRNRAVPDRVRSGVRGVRGMAGRRNRRWGAVRMGSGQHLRAGAPLLHGPGPGGGADRADQRRTGAVEAG